MQQNLKNLLILIFGLIVYSIFHTIGTYGYKYWEKNNTAVWIIMILGIFFGSFSYFIKVPLFYYYDNQSSVSTYVLYVGILSVIVTLFSKFVLEEKIQWHTYIILSLVLMLVSYNEYLNLNP